MPRKETSDLGYSFSTIRESPALSKWRKYWQTVKQ
jgi:hypothetical protein